jgi:two-component system, LytTR family, response regulator
VTAPRAPLRVAIADDELQARKRLVRLAREHGDVEVVAACASAEELLAALPGARADVLLLDISMPGRSGLEVREVLGDGAPPIVFVTAHPEHAASAFDLGVVDYVVKPVTADRLAKALARVRQAARQPPRLTIETHRGLVVLDPTELIAARLDGVLVTLVTKGGELPTTLTLKALAARLPPGKFARLDRQHLVNLDHLARLAPQANGGATAVMRSGLELPVSRQAARTLRRRLKP